MDGRARRQANLTRGRQGRVPQLPPELREYIDRRLREGAPQKAIIDETRQMLADIGEAPLSSSGLQRYTARVERAAHRINRARDAAASIVAGLDELNQGDLTRLMVDMLRSAIFDAIVLEDQGKEGRPALDPSLIGKMALALNRLEDSARVSQQRERELRKAIADDVLREHGKGLSTPMAQRIRAAIEGAAE